MEPHWDRFQDLEIEEVRQDFRRPEFGVFAGPQIDRVLSRGIALARAAAKTGELLRRRVTCSPGLCEECSAVPRLAIFVELTFAQDAHIEDHTRGRRDHQIEVLFPTRAAEPR